MSIMNIAWLFPDTLYLHGERGNILAIQKMCEKAGQDSKVTKIDFNTKDFDPLEYDLIFCPPGEVASFQPIIDWLKPHKNKLVEFIIQKKILFVTGTSIGIWCKEIKRCDKTVIKGLGILDVIATEREDVYGDDNYFICKVNEKNIEVIGNQIQMLNFENKDEKTFGKLLYGFGNTGNDREEGFINNNSIFTNTLAPMLIANPLITKEFVKIMCYNKGIKIEDFEIDTEIEEKSFATKKDFILTKVTNLTNCSK